MDSGDTGFQYVQESINSHIERGEIAGAAVAVAHRGEMVLDWATGNAREGVTASTSTLWPLASISKVYTAAMIMVLVEQGKLSLSLPVAAVLEGFTGDGRDEITLRHLLTHTSGLIYESPNMEQLLIDHTPYEEMVDEAYTYPLLFSPGSYLSYADYNFAIAGRVATVVTGRSFPELVRELVLEPGGLADTFMPPPESEYGRLAVVDNPLAAGTDGAMYNAPYALDLAHPAFGTVATAADMARFGLLFAPGGTTRILSHAGIKAMTSDQTGGNVTTQPATAGTSPPFSGTAAQPWGVGFMLKGLSSMGGDLLSPESFGHGGASGCTLWVDPVEDIVISYVSNSHARNGRMAFSQRQVRTVNSVMAALTRG